MPFNTGSEARFKPVRLDQGLSASGPYQLPRAISRSMIRTGAASVDRIWFFRS